MSNYLTKSMKLSMLLLFIEGFNSLLTSTVLAAGMLTSAVGTAENLVLSLSNTSCFGFYALCLTRCYTFYVTNIAACVALTDCDLLQG